MAFLYTKCDEMRIHHDVSSSSIYDQTLLYVDVFEPKHWLVLLIHLHAVC